MSDFIRAAWHVYSIIAGVSLPLAVFLLAWCLKPPSKLDVKEGWVAYDEFMATEKYAEELEEALGKSQDRHEACLSELKEMRHNFLVAQQRLENSKILRPQTPYEPNALAMPESVHVFTSTEPASLSAPLSK